MKIGICAWAFDGGVQGRRAVSEMAEAAAAAGFDALEGAVSVRTPWSNESLAVPVSSLTTLALQRFPLTSTNVRHRQAGILAVRSMIAAAHLIRARSISFSPGALSPHDSTEDGTAEVIPVLRMLAEEALQAGVQIAVENLPRHWLATRRATEALLLHIPELRLCLDVGNALVDPPIDAWFDTFNERIIKIHISDGYIDGDQFVPSMLGAGEVRWSKVSGEVQRLCQDIDVYLETPPRYGFQAQPEATFLSSARRAVAEAIECI